MFSNPATIGLDLGSHNIKMVEVENAKKDPQLTTYGVAEHTLKLEGYWDSSKLRQLSRIIDEIMDYGNFGGVKTVMSVASKDVYVTTMDFDIELKRPQIEKEIRKQAPYFLPYPPDEMRLSWSLIENDPRIRSKTGKQRVIINALPDFVIENAKNLLEHCNLDGAALENQTISQIRSSLTPDTGNTVLVDFGANQTTFSIIVEGVLRSSSHIPTGSHKINEYLSEDLGLDKNSTEYLKHDLSLINLYTLPDPIQDVLTELKTELKTFIDLNKKVAQKPEKIVFTGGGIYIAGFLEFFQDMELPVYRANPSRQVKISEDYLPYINPIINQLSSAIGLAIRSDI